MKTEIKPEIPKYRLTDPRCIKRQKIADMKTRMQMLNMQPKTPQGLEEIKILAPFGCFVKINLTVVSFNTYQVTPPIGRN